MKTFVNVTSLKLAKLKVGQNVSTQGYSSAGDGGGATYLIVAPQSFDGYGDHELANSNVAVLQINNGTINALQFGLSTSASATFNAAAIKTATDSLKKVVIPYASSDYEITYIFFASNSKLVIHGNLQSDSSYPFTLSSVDNVNIKFKGGSLKGDGVTNAQSGISVNNSTNCKIYHPRLDLFLNKGVDIKGTSNNNQIIKPYVRGATGTSGAGISLAGEAVKHNKVINADCSTNRIGITINGADYNTITRPVCNECADSGVSIDGLVATSGDGGQYNIIESPICNDGTDATYGGIYCGNGSSFNRFISPICNGNAGAGIRFSGGSGYENESNVVISPVCNSNGINGITLSYCPDFEILSPTCKLNTGKGITEANSIRMKIIGGNVSDNTTVGILHQSPNTLDDDVTVVDNGSHGIQIAFGGTIPIDGTNRTVNCHMSGNTGTDYVPAGGSTAKDCTGFVTDKKGSDTKADGQTINHGLSGTPDNIHVTGSVASEMISVTAKGATTFTVAIKKDDGTAGTSQEIYWEASLY